MPPVSLVERVRSARARAEQLVAVSDMKYFCAWQRVAASQTRLRVSIRGGSAPDPLIAAIRAALEAGALPRIDRQTWAGKALGNHVCACCGRRIDASDVEYGPRVAPGRYAHIGCFTAWHMESALLAQPRDASPGAAAAGA